MRSMGFVLGFRPGSKDAEMYPALRVEAQRAPLFLRTLEAIRGGGAEEIVALLSGRSGAIAEALPDDVGVIVQDKPSCTDSGLFEVMGLLDDEDVPLVLGFGDAPSVAPKSVRRLLRSIADGADAAVLTFLYEEVSPFCHFARKKAGHFVEITQTTSDTCDTVRIHELDVGLFAFRSGALRRAVEELGGGVAGAYLLRLLGLVAERGGIVECISAESLDETSYEDKLPSSSSMRSGGGLKSSAVVSASNEDLAVESRRVPRLSLRPKDGDGSSSRPSKHPTMRP